MKKFIITLLASMAYVATYADSNPCPCADGTQPYTVDCDGDGTPEKCAGEKCCNSDAGEYANTSIPGYSGGVSGQFQFGPWTIVDCDLVKITVPAITSDGGTWEIPAAQGKAPLSSQLTGGRTITVSSFGRLYIFPSGSLTVYEYVPCIGSGCGDEQTKTDELNVELKDRFTFTVCGVEMSTTATHPFNQKPQGVPLKTHKFKKCN